MQNKSLKFIWMLTVFVVCVLIALPAAAQKKPNILIIWAEPVERLLEALRKILG